MRFQGRIFKEGKHWLIEAPLFDALTQGRTQTEAFEMMKDWFRTAVDRRNFRVTLDRTGTGEFDIVANDVRPMIALLLQRQRQRSGLSLAQVAQRLGAKSRNAYARYENGSSVPTVEKLEELLRAVAPDCDLVVRQRCAA
ncbi:MAG TPA: helix-turn-helix transcriptional regulator [Candidatus Binatia bacterium]|nr:helix-turn-helix transcriptional regulator [Candidatus Binatia bacterium]